MRNYSITSRNDLENVKHMSERKRVQKRTTIKRRKGQMFMDGKNNDKVKQRAGKKKKKLNSKSNGWIDDPERS